MSTNPKLNDAMFVVIQGPAGHYKPRRDSYLNCETSREMCANFQDGRNSEQPCDREYDFRCFYSYSYGDGSRTGGSVINADIRFDLTDGSKARHSIAIGYVRNSVSDHFCLHCKFVDGSHSNP